MGAEQVLEKPQPGRVPSSRQVGNTGWREQEIFLNRMPKGEDIQKIILIYRENPPSPNREEGWGVGADFHSLEGDEHLEVLS